MLNIFTTGYHTAEMIVHGRNHRELQTLTLAMIQWALCVLVLVPDPHTRVWHQDYLCPRVECACTYSNSNSNGATYIQLMLLIIPSIRGQMCTVVEQLCYKGRDRCRGCYRIPEQSHNRDLKIKRVWVTSPG